MANRNLPSLRALQAFEAAANHLSFTKAARDLNLTQSAISKQIKLLEDDFQQSFFIRENNTLKLTPEGQVLMGYIQPALDNFEEIFQKVRGYSYQDFTLKIAAPPTFLHRWLLPRLNRFYQSFPNINIVFQTIYDFSFMEQNIHAIDLAIFYGEPVFKNIEETPLFTERHICVCAPSIYESVRDTMQLEGQTLIHLARGSRAYLLWERWSHIANVSYHEKANRFLFFDNFNAMIASCVWGHGIAIVDANMLYNEIESQLLCQWQEDELILPFGYTLLVSNKRKKSFATQQFQNWIVQEAAC